MTTLGPSLSVIVSGLLLSVADWHLLFWVFSALCIVCFILGAIFVSNVAKLTNPKLDVLSVILISLALVGVLYGISTVFKNVIPAVITFVVGIVCFVLFVLRQKKLSEPLINFAPLQKRLLHFQFC